MKINKLIECNYIIIFFLMLAVFSFKSYAQVSVIVSKESQYELTDSQVKNIFMGNMLSWPDGSKVVIVDQPESASGKDFYSKFIEQSINKIRVKWTKLVLSGQASAPLKVDNDDEVKKNVASNQNAIGYISSSEVDDTVKEILRIE
ncbi:MAG: phosphate ABC transporter substrate-binding protein [Ignavibacteria bacterium]